MNRLSDVLKWLDGAPTGTQVSASALHQILSDVLDAKPQPEVTPAGVSMESSWQEKIWTCPAETRLTVADLSEAIGRSTSWIYKRTGPKSVDERIPCRRLAGELVFVADEIRRWMKDNETIIEPGPPYLKAS